MSKQQESTISYEERLAAVVTARRAAEDAHRHGDVEALRLAEHVLLDLIAEQRKPKLQMLSGHPDGARSS